MDNRAKASPETAAHSNNAPLVTELLDQARKVVDAIREKTENAKKARDAVRAGLAFNLEHLIVGDLERLDALLQLLQRGVDYQLKRSALDVLVWTPEVTDALAAAAGAIFVRDQSGENIEVTRVEWHAWAACGKPQPVKRWVNSYREVKG